MPGRVPTARLFAALAGCAALALPGAAAAAPGIVVNQSIAGVSIGMTRAQVVHVLGRPHLPETRPEGCATEFGNAWGMNWSRNVQRTDLTEVVLDARVSLRTVSRGMTRSRWRTVPLTTLDFALALMGRRRTRVY